MTSRVRPGLLSLWLFAALVLFAPAAFAAPTTEQCVAAYEQGQQQRAQGKLASARQNFLVCAEASCPDLTKTDCSQWIGEVEGSLPSLIFAVTDSSGRDVTDVAVSIDGQRVLTSLDGKALPIDPGKHKLRFEKVGEAPIEMELVAREGERNRRVEVKLGSGGSSSSSGGSGGIEHVHPAAWAIGVVGVAGLGIFGVLGGIGLKEKADAEEECAPECSDDVLDSIRTKFIVADVALAAGLVTLAAGVTIGIVTGLGGEDEPSAAVILAPRLGGGEVVFLGQF